MSSTKFKSSFSDFKKLKRSGNYKRNIKNQVKKIIGINENPKKLFESTTIIEPKITYESSINPEIERYMETNELSHNWIIDDDEEFTENLSPNIDNSELDWNSVGIKFREKLSTWAVESHTTREQLKNLLDICNSTLPFQLPKDPRTIMLTPRSVNITTFEDGAQYWHHGVKTCLDLALNNISDPPSKISLNINADGLPIYVSSSKEFWPLLFNIHERRDIEPMIIGIYLSPGKKIFHLKEFCSIN